MVEPESREATLEPWLEPENSWALSSVSTALRDHESGSFGDSGLLAEYMDRNARIRSSLDTRINGILGLEMQFEPPAQQPKRQAKRFAREIQERWFDIVPEDIDKEMKRWLFTMGFALAEVTWKPVGSTWMPQLHPWHAANVAYNSWERVWEVYDRQGVRHIVTPGDGRWLLLRATPNRPWMRGVVRCLGIEDTLRYQAVRDWGRWSEKYGLAILKAMLPANESSTTGGKLFFSSLRSIGKEAVVKCPQGEGPESSYDLEFLEPKTVAWQGFMKLLDLVAGDASIAILGQNLTTEIKGASLAAAKVHDLVRYDYIKADVETDATSYRDQLLKPYIRFNHGAGLEDMAPFPTRLTEQREDEGDRAKVLGDAAIAISGLLKISKSVDVEALLAEFRVPILQGAKVQPEDIDSDPDADE